VASDFVQDGSGAEKAGWLLVLVFLSSMPNEWSEKEKLFRE